MWDGAAVVKWWRGNPDHHRKMAGPGHSSANFSYKRQRSGMAAGDPLNDKEKP